MHDPEELGARGDGQAGGGGRLGAVRAIGLMGGTSLDGVDVALAVETFLAKEKIEKTSVAVVGFHGPDGPASACGAADRANRRREVLAVRLAGGVVARP
jgi:1,6-anhydro-N-acetylmuramate kinase